MTRTDAFLILAAEPRRHANGQTYSSTFKAGVVATDIEDAIRAFKAFHPDATLWTVSHQIQIEIITSDAAVLVTENINKEA